MTYRTILFLFTLGLSASWLTPGPVNADVIPVPSEVVPEAIPEAKPRNVVFILSDDHRYDAMGFMGHPLAKTPHMDAMAREGVHLKNVFLYLSHNAVHGPFTPE